MQFLKVFILMIFIGLMVLLNSRPWHDEQYTSKNVSEYSYSDILMGKLPEGCNGPLWYLIEKPLGLTGSRVLSVAFMSLAGALMGWWGFGLLSVKITWQHIAEARPYALVVLLTTWQWLCVVGRSKGLWLVNILMAFTHSICVVPIVLASLVTRKWQTAILPIIILSFYFHQLQYGPGIFRMSGYSNRYFIYLVPMEIILLKEVYERCFNKTRRHIWARTIME
jgi:hypothetical protein